MISARESELEAPNPLRLRPQDEAALREEHGELQESILERVFSRSHEREAAAQCEVASEARERNSLTWEDSEERLEGVAPYLSGFLWR